MPSIQVRPEYCFTFQTKNNAHYYIFVSINSLYTNCHWCCQVHNREM